MCTNHFFPSNSRLFLSSSLSLSLSLFLSFSLTLPQSAATLSRIFIYIFSLFFSDHKMLFISKICIKQSYYHVCVCVCMNVHTKNKFHSISGRRLLPQYCF